MLAYTQIRHDTTKKKIHLHDDNYVCAYMKKYHTSLKKLNDTEPNKYVCLNISEEIWHETTKKSLKP